MQFGSLSRQGKRSDQDDVVVTVYLLGQVLVCCTWAQVHAAYLPDHEWVIHTFGCDPRKLHEACKGRTQRASAKMHRKAIIKSGQGVQRPSEELKPAVTKDIMVGKSRAVFE